MRVLIFGAGGSALAWFFASAARRYAVADRLNADRKPPPRRMPAWLTARIDRSLDAAAIDVPASRALSTWMWAVVVAGVIGTAAGGPEIALGFASMVAVGIPLVVVSMRERRARQIAVAVPETLEYVASELRSGGTVATAIGSVARGDGPIAVDMTRVEARMRLGASMEDALRAWSAEREVPGVDASAGALVMCAAVGGRSADALEGLATSLRDRLAVAAEARALSSQARMSAIVVGGAPVAYIAWSAMIDPHSLHVLVVTLFGRACLGVGLSLEGVGFLWMRAIVRRGSAG